MNTILTTASMNAILAIDLGKYKSVAGVCRGDPATAGASADAQARSRNHLNATRR